MNFKQKNREVSHVTPEDYLPGIFSLAQNKICIFIEHVLSILTSTSAGLAHEV